jgi:hypothetical protein
MRATTAVPLKLASRSGRVLRITAALLLLACSVSVSAQAAKTAKDAPSAVLIKGTISARGLPFFGPNAIGALYGEYLLGAGAQDAASAVSAAGEGSAKYEDRLVSAWYTRDHVVLSSAWKGSTAAGAGARVLARPEGPVLFLEGEGYSLFLEIGAESASTLSFARALNRKFVVFFRNASSDAELSFPSTVEY